MEIGWSLSFILNIVAQFGHCGMGFLDYFLKINLWLLEFTLSITRDQWLSGLFSQIMELLLLLCLIRLSVIFLTLNLSSLVSSLHLSTLSLL